MSGNNNVSDYALTGVSGAVITTGPGNDVVATEATTLRRITRDGADKVDLSGKAGIVRVETASGDDLVVLALRDGADFLRVRTQQGNDEFSLPGFDYAWSGYGDDTITGSADRNVIWLFLSKGG